MGNIPEPAPEPDLNRLRVRASCQTETSPMEQTTGGSPGSAAIESSAAVLASRLQYGPHDPDTVRLQQGQKTYALIVDVAECGAGCNLALMTIMDAIPRQSRRYPRPVIYADVYNGPAHG